MTEPYWSDDQVTLYFGDCLEVLAGLSDASVDAIVTDPPAGISFMGREWDGDRGGRDQWIAWLAERLEQAARCLKPGGHALIWALPRTSHWTAMAIEDAGLEIRDSLHHMFGSGYPKSLDVSKAIDKQRNDRPSILRVTSWLADIADAKGIARAQVDEHMGTSDMGGWWLSRLEHRCAVPTWDQWLQLRGLIGFGDEMDAEVWRLNGRKGRPGEAWSQRETIGEGYRVRRESDVQIVGLSDGAYDITAPATENAARWEGWGTTLKPAHEVWWLARKPMASTVAANVLRHGTGALNVDGCKVGSERRTNNAGGSSSLQRVSRVEYGYRPTVTASEGQPSDVSGRWPSNIVLSHSAACESVGTRTVKSDGHHPASRGLGGLGTSGHAGQEGLAERRAGTETIEAWDCAPDCPVAELDRQTGVLTSGANPTRRGSDKFRDAYGEFAGQEACTPRRGADSGGASRFYPVFRYQAKAATSERPRLEDGTAHETVKSVGLMQWLVRLITPPGGLVLDCFAGSGTTAEACIIEGFRCLLIENKPRSCELIRKRLSKPIQPAMFGEAVGT